MRSRLRLAAHTAAATTAAAALLASCSAMHSDSARPAASGVATQGPYVALGDSYTSGAGIPDPTGSPAGCRRSSSDYPALVAQGLHLSADAVRDVSCQGATIAALSGAQSTGDGTSPAQLDALAKDTALVTLGIGGNDVDFSGTLTRCTTLDLAPTLIGHFASDLTPCRDYYTSGGTDQIQQKISGVAGHLDTALSQIRQRAPHARILVVGYPALFPDNGAGCAHTLGFTPGDVTFLREKEVQLNSMLRQRAQSAGATYVDTYAGSLGHDACAAPAVRWIEPMIPASPAAPFHPNARGAQDMADSILRAVGAANAAV